MIKKSFTILLTLIILLSFFVQAQTEDNKTAVPKTEIKDLTPKIDERLEKQVTIPQGLRTISRVALGINSNEQIEVSSLITIIALWILIFIVSLTALKLVPSLNPLAVGIAAFCVSCLIGSTKALSLATERWLSNEELFRFIDGWEFGNLMLNIIAIILLIVIALVIREKMKKANEEDKKERLIDGIKAWFAGFRNAP